MIQITLLVIIISLQYKNIVSQECTNTQEPIDMHKANCLRLEKK